MDKKIRINLDRDYDIKLNIKPNRKNIYSHDNKIIRRLCDYKFQVCAHWHSYWYGPRNKPELRHKERRWVEAYYKNDLSKRLLLFSKSINMDLEKSMIAK